MRYLQRGKVRVVYDIVREYEPDFQPMQPMTSSEGAIRTFRALQEKSIIPMEREAFVVCALDSRHNMIGVQVVSIGSMQSSIVHPREVFRYAITIGACSIVLAHNHPSNDVSPSREDETVTERLKEVGKVVGIQILDHLIVCKDESYSFALEGKI